MPAHDASWPTRCKLLLLAGGMIASLLTLNGCATVDAQTLSLIHI